MSPFPKRSAGFSLLELLIALSLLLLVSGIAFGFYGRYSQRYQVELEAGNLTSTGDRGMNQILADLRLADYPPARVLPYGPNYTGASDNLVARGFLAIGPSAVSFEGALGNAGATTLSQGFGTNGLLVDQVGYSLAAMSAAQAANCVPNPQYPAGSFWTLSRTVAPKSTSGGVANANAAIVLDHVFSATANAPQIFSYYDQTGAVTATPSAVAEIKVALVLQTCAGDLRNHLPVQLPFSGTAYIRNLGQ